jgi:hypothetical protein
MFRLSNFAIDPLGLIGVDRILYAHTVIRGACLAVAEFRK